MFATLGELPAAPGWAYEFKWDGVQAITYLDLGQVHIWSRNDREVTTSYPELSGLGQRFARERLVLDGEIIALDNRGAPSFSRLQRRMHVRAPTPGLVERVPVQLYLFDLLHQGRRSTLGLPYTRRRQLLEEFAVDEATVKTPPYFANGNGAEPMHTAAELCLEGVIAERLDSTYQPGVRSRAWIESPLNKTVEVLVAGWRPGAGRRAGLIGALLLGMYDEAGRLRYVGKVGTGFTDHMLRDLHHQLAPLKRSTPPLDMRVPREDARDAHWVEPRLVGEVAYRTRSPDGGGCVIRVGDGYG